MVKLVDINIDFIICTLKEVEVVCGRKICLDPSSKEEEQILPSFPILYGQRVYCLCKECNDFYKKSRIQDLHEDFKGYEDNFSKYNERYEEGEKTMNKDVDYLIIGWNKESKPVCLVLECKKTGSERQQAKKQLKETIFVLCSLYKKNIDEGENYPRKNIAPIVPCFYITREGKRHRKMGTESSIEMCGMTAELHTLGPGSRTNKKNWERITNQTDLYWENHK